MELAKTTPGPSPRRPAASADPASLIVLHSGYTVLCSSPDGAIEPGRPTGLFDFDARILSLHRLTIDDDAPSLVSQRRLSNDRWVAVLRQPLPGGDAKGPGLPQDALAVLVERIVCRGLRERLTLVNHSMVRTRATVRLDVDGDFADIREAPSTDPLRGRVEDRWDETARTLVLTYEGRHGDQRLERGVRLRVIETDAPVERAGRGLVLNVDLGPGAAASVTLAFDSLVDEAWRTPPDGEESRDLERARSSWAATRPRLDPSDDMIAPAFEGGARDLFALRNRELETLLDPAEGAAWIVNAGVPTFVSAPPPQALDGAGSLVEVADLFALQHAPLRAARAARIALGIEAGPKVMDGPIPGWKRRSLTDLGRRQCWIDRALFRPLVRRWYRPKSRPASWEGGARLPSVHAGVGRRS